MPDSDVQTTHLRVFKEIEFEGKNLLQTILDGLEEATSVSIQLFKKEIINEGDSWTVQMDNGTPYGRSYSELRARCLVEDLKVRETDTDYFLGKISEMAIDLYGKLDSRAFELLSETAEAAGNVMDCSEQGFTPEVLIEMINRKETSFDKNGKSNITLVIPQELVSTLLKWKDDPEINARIEAAIQRKREEYFSKLDK